MSTLSLDSASWQNAAFNANDGSHKAVATKSAAVAQAEPQDTVKLSPGAQVSLLYHSGQSVTTIASTLGISKSDVNSYLGLIEATAIQVSASAGGGGGGTSTSSQSTATVSAGTIASESTTTSTATADSGQATTAAISDVSA